MAAKARWDTYLIKNKQGGYMPCLRNAVAILTHRGEWRNVIAYDAFAGVVVKMKEPPWGAKDSDLAPERALLGDWTREDSMRTACWITDEYNCDMKTHIVDEAVQVVAQRWEAHPVRDYLNSLKWDKKPRLDTFLVRMGGAADTPYVRAVTKNFFLGAVARIMAPGAQVDTVLVLEGAQGLGKSTMLRTLASDAWFMDTIFNLGSKDGYQALRSKWIVEFSELDALSRVELSRVKAFISSVKDTYRQSYGRSASDFLRQCVFAGTVNPGAGYLNDPTGARRFWPVTLTKSINHKLVKAERDQLWAEAFRRYTSKNEPWHFRDPKLLKAAAQETEARREAHPWEAFFRKWLAKHDRTRRGVTTEEMLTKAAEVRKADQDRTSQIDAGKALRAIGWDGVRRGTDNIRRYFPGEAAAKETVDHQDPPPIPPNEKRGLGGREKGKRKRGS